MSDLVSSDDLLYREVEYTSVVLLRFRTDQVTCSCNVLTSISQWDWNWKCKSRNDCNLMDKDSSESVRSGATTTLVLPHSTSLRIIEVQWGVALFPSRNP